VYLSLAHQTLNAPRCDVGQTTSSDQVRSGAV